MSRAEDIYLEHFQDGRLRNCSSKDVFLLGYHQAEKDNELTWEDIETIQEMANKYCKYHSCEPRIFVYSEVLKQFKYLKERKEK